MKACREPHAVKNDQADLGAWKKQFCLGDVQAYDWQGWVASKNVKEPWEYIKW